MTKKPTEVISINGRKAATLAPAGLPKLTRAQFAAPVNGPITNASIPADQVVRFTLGLAHMVALSRVIDSECDAEIAAHDAISKAKGE